MQRTDDFEKSCIEVVLPNLEHDNEYELNQGDKPLSSDSTHTIPITERDIVVRQKVASSDKYHVTGTRTIIDDIVGWSTSKSLIILMLECICRVSMIYRSSFKLSKYECFYERFEYVGHDIMAGGNTTVQSKYDLINNWSTPATGDGFHSFVSLCNYYNKFCPMFHLRAISLCQLYIRYTRKSIQSIAWTPELISLFDSLKIVLASSPVLARYDSSLPIFLKTDWSATGVEFIIMQPATDKVYVEALRALRETGENKSDCSLEGPRLRPILFGSRICIETESYYYSFVGEVSTSRWAILENRIYFWGTHFYWLCDMKTMYKILSYDGPIHTLRRWTQELLAYSFICVHRPNTMM